MASSKRKHVVETLRKILDDDAISKVLNRSKQRSPDGETWNKRTVAQFREDHRIPVFSSQAKTKNGWMTQAEAANRLGVSPMSITRLVKNGTIPAEQTHPGMPTVIKPADLQLEQVMRAISQLKDSNNRPLSHHPDQLNLFKNSDSGKDVS